MHPAFSQIITLVCTKEAGKKNRENAMVIENKNVPPEISLTHCAQCGWLHFGANLICSVACLHVVVSFQSNDFTGL